MDRILNNLQVLWRTERAVADIRLRHAIARSGFQVAAALLALVGLLMFEVAAFYLLRDHWNTVAAALILGAVNFAFAGILLLIADRRRPGRELDLANEIHRNTMSALQADARLLQADFASLQQALKHPLDSALPALIVPLATIVINALKKKAAPPQ